MMRTLRDMNMSKFVAEDVPLFLSLIDDLFPAQNADRASFPEVSAALEHVFKEKNLQPHPNWVNKCIQLYETTLVRCEPPAQAKPKANAQSYCWLRCFRCNKMRTPPVAVLHFATPRPAHKLLCLLPVCGSTPPSACLHCRPSELADS